MFSRVGPAAYKKDIHNTITLCEALGNPQNKFKSIHVAGTNGKGSTSHMLAAILQQQGYKTGLYTSPHIKDFGERIRINGQMIDHQFVIDFTEKTKELCNSIEPSFFELTVAMAFSYFAEENIDIAIIETGLGGRLDSTNIIQPVLSVITNIGIDHANLLGDTIEKIAFEKAGIIKHKTPVVIGESNDNTKQIFQAKANEMSAPIFWADELYSNRKINSDGKQLICDVTDHTHQHSETFTLDLTGNYQLKNLLTVLAAEKILLQSGFMIEEINEKIALSNVKKLTGMRGRWDIVAHDPDIIHDVGHNKDGICQILHQLQLEYPNAHCHFILGFVNDKDISEMLKMFPKDASYYFTNAHIARALQNEKLKEMAREIGLQGDSYENVNQALEKAKSNSKKSDVIVVCGSFFILSEIND
jgi:dihydrofolate synthase/folylpolyglutamate synthase